MTKVQKNILDCFLPMESAQTFCQIHSYVSTCRENCVSVGEALECLLRGERPNFIQKKWTNEPQG